jgi:putative component of membrane protein insertase Oxa1/YidC/SpoIIIJ protein YidD
LFYNPLWATSYNSLSVTGNWAIALYQKLISPLQGREICNFSPSCSNFSKQAINKYGMFWGVLMTADRLERCNFAAGNYADRYYPGIVNDRFYDPIDNHYLFAQARIPDSNIDLVPPAPAVEYFTKETDFADYLFSHQDYVRAAAEFKRVTFTTADENAKHYARFMTGESLLRADSLASALQIFKECKTDDNPRAPLYDYEQGRSLFLSGRYPPAREKLTPVTGDLAYRAKVIQGWSFFKERNFSAGARVFAQDPTWGQLAHFNGRNLPTRSRVLATVFSTLIPGLGQTYSGRLGDGLFSLMVTSTFGAAAYYYYKKDEPLKFSFLGALALVFWAGNVYGADIAARDYNELKKREYLTKIEEILSPVNLTPDYANYFRQ